MKQCNKLYKRVGQKKEIPTTQFCNALNGRVTVMVE